MPPTTADRLIHVLRAIEIIENLLAQKTLEDFTADIPLRLAVERGLEIICEASRRLPDNIKAQCPNIEWQRMVNFGNLLRHAYHRVDPQAVFNIVAQELPPLKVFAEKVVREDEK
jgi:uncharacterized protein with HEPN domain